MWPFSKKKPIQHKITQSGDLVLGNTANCVCCGKPITGRSWVGTGHVRKNSKEIIMARFCDNLCIRNLTFQKYDWNGMPWIPEYGLIKHEEPFLI